MRPAAAGFPADPPDTMFTVVIPLYEKRAYVQRALDSIYAQAIEPAAVPEIIVVNDGSTDGGEAIAKAQTDPRVRVIDQPNRGVSAARNAGIAAASQPFIAFLDADDRWRPEFLARMRDLIAKHPGAALYGSGFVTIRGGIAVDDHAVRSTDLLGGGGDLGQTVAGPVDFFRAWCRDHVVHPSGMVVPKQTAMAIGGFRMGLAYCEDHLFLTHLGLAGPVVLTSERLVEYDIAVPGQFIEYWRGPYQERFDVLDYHRFLAEEVRRRTAGGSREADASFVAYGRRQLRTAVLQRLYWGNFAALETMWRELRLDGLGLGWPADWCGWIARHPAARLPVALLMAVARRVRRILSGGQRERRIT